MDEVLALLGLGLGTFIPANNALIMGAIPASCSGTGGGLVNMTRGLGTALGVALVAWPSTPQTTALGRYSYCSWSRSSRWERPGQDRAGAQLPGRMWDTANCERPSGPSTPQQNEAHGEP
ncbi:hypothetical protein [Streptomyces sp. NPDC056682]|uniref:hypothetical protein n=1 Tax=Streptomyces sp. NPDC056682 TaxID=3345909 RepID=UPI0036C16CBE